MDIVARRDGKDVKQTVEGKQVTTVNSEVGVKVEVGPLKVGLSRSNTQEEGKPPKVEWVPGFEKGKFEGSNAEVGLGVGGCVLICGQIEGGVQADKVVNDAKNAVSDAISNSAGKDIVNQYGSPF